MNTTLIYYTNQHLPPWEPFDAQAEPFKSADTPDDGCGKMEKSDATLIKMDKITLKMCLSILYQWNFILIHHSVFAYNMYIYITYDK